VEQPCQSGSDRRLDIAVSERAVQVEPRRDPFQKQRSLFSSSSGRAATITTRS